MANRIQYTIGFNADVSRAQKALQEFDKSITALEKRQISLNFSSSSVNQAVDSARELGLQVQKALDVDTGKLNLTTFVSNLEQSKTSLKELSSNLLSAGAEGQAAFSSLASAIAQSEVPLKQTNSLLKNFGTTIKNTVKWEISSNIVHSLESAFSNAIGYVKSLNSSLNDIRIVTGYSADDMTKFAEQANKAARTLSTTTKAYSDASLIYFQQGDDSDTVAKKAAITTKAANTAFSASAEEMSEMLTAVWNSYQVGENELEKYVDIMAALGAATATSTEEIATAMQKVAATANTVGVSMEQMSSIIATVSSVTREAPESIGTSYKTILARIGDLKLGETLDDGTTLGTVSSQLKQIGVDVLDANGNLNDMGDVLESLMDRWSGLTDAQKTATAQVVAGKRQYTQLMALMENQDMYKKSMNIAETSEGTLQNQADIYAESFSAASNRMQAALEGLYSKLIDDDALITLTEGLTGAIDLVGELIDAFGGLGGTLSTIGSLLTTIFSKQISQGVANSVVKAGTYLGQFSKENRKAANGGEDIGFLKYIRSGKTKSYNQIEYQKSAAELNTQFNEVKASTQRGTSAYEAIDNAQKLLSYKQQLLQIEGSLSESEKQSVSTAIDLYDKQMQQLIKTKQEKEEIIEQSKSEIKLNADSAATIMGKSGSFSDDKTKGRISSGLIKSTIKDNVGAKIGQAVKEGKTLNTSDLSNLLTQEKSSFQKYTPTTWGDLFKSTQNRNRTATATSRYISDLDKIKKNLDGATKSKNADDIKKYNEQFEEMRTTIRGVLGESGIGETDGIDQATDALKKYQEEAHDALATMEALVDTQVKLLKASGNEEAANRLATAFSIASSSGEELGEADVREGAQATGAEKADKKIDEALNPDKSKNKTKATAEKIGKVVTGAAQAVEGIVSGLSVGANLMDTFSDKTATLTDKLSAAAGAAASIGSRLLAGDWIGAAATAVSSIVGYFIQLSKQAKEDYQQAQKEKIEEATNKATETTDEMTEQAKLIQNYSTLYDTYARTGEGQEQLKESAYALADAYGLVGANVLIAQGNFKEFNNLMKEQLNLSMDKQINILQDQIEELDKQITDTNTNSLYKIGKQKVYSEAAEGTFGTALDTNAIDKVFDDEMGKINESISTANADVEKKAGTIWDTELSRLLRQVNSAKEDLEELSSATELIINSELQNQAQGSLLLTDTEFEEIQKQNGKYKKYTKNDFYTELLTNPNEEIISVMENAGLEEKIQSYVDYGLIDYAKGYTEKSKVLSSDYKAEKIATADRNGEDYSVNKKLLNDYLNDYLNASQKYDSAQLDYNRIKTNKQKYIDINTIPSKTEQDQETEFPYQLEAKVLAQAGVLTDPEDILAFGKGTYTSQQNKFLNTLFGSFYAGQPEKDLLYGDLGFDLNAFMKKFLTSFNLNGPKDLINNMDVQKLFKQIMKQLYDGTQFDVDDMLNDYLEDGFFNNDEYTFNDSQSFRNAWFQFTKTDNEEIEEFISGIKSQATKILTDQMVSDESLVNVPLANVLNKGIEEIYGMEKGSSIIGTLVNEDGTIRWDEYINNNDLDGLQQQFVRLQNADVAIGEYMSSIREAQETLAEDSEEYRNLEKLYNEWEQTQETIRTYTQNTSLQSYFSNRSDYQKSIAQLKVGQQIITQLFGKSEDDLDFSTFTDYMTDYENAIIEMASNYDELEDYMDATGKHIDEKFMTGGRVSDAGLKQIIHNLALDTINTYTTFGDTYGRIWKDFVSTFDDSTDQFNIAKTLLEKWSGSENFSYDAITSEFVTALDTYLDLVTQYVNGAQNEVKDTVEEIAESSGYLQTLLDAQTATIDLDKMETDLTNITNAISLSEKGGSLTVEEMKDIQKSLSGITTEDGEDAWEVYKNIKTTEGRTAFLNDLKKSTDYDEMSKQADAALQKKLDVQAGLREAAYTNSTKQDGWESFITKNEDGTFSGWQNDVQGAKYGLTFDQGTIWDVLAGGAEIFQAAKNELQAEGDNSWTYKTTEQDEEGKDQEYSYLIEQDEQTKEYTITKRKILDNGSVSEAENDKEVLDSKASEAFIKNQLLRVGSKSGGMNEDLYEQLSSMGYGTSLETLDALIGLMSGDEANAAAVADLTATKEALEAMEAVVGALTSKFTTLQSAMTTKPSTLQGWKDLADTINEMRGEDEEVTVEDLVGMSDYERAELAAGTSRRKIDSIYDEEKADQKFENYRTVMMLHGKEPLTKEQWLAENYAGKTGVSSDEYAYYGYLNDINQEAFQDAKITQETMRPTQQLTELQNAFSTLNSIDITSLPEAGTAAYTTLGDAIATTGQSAEEAMSSFKKLSSVEQTIKLGEAKIANLNKQIEQQRLIVEQYDGGNNFANMTDKEIKSLSDDKFQEYLKWYSAQNTLDNLMAQLDSQKQTNASDVNKAYAAEVDKKIAKAQEQREQAQEEIDKLQEQSDILTEHVAEGGALTAAEQNILGDDYSQKYATATTVQARAALAAGASSQYYGAQITAEQEEKSATQRALSALNSDKNDIIENAARSAHSPADDLSVLFKNSGYVATTEELKKQLNQRGLTPEAIEKYIAAYEKVTETLGDDATVGDYFTAMTKELQDAGADAQDTINSLTAQQSDSISTIYSTLAQQERSVAQTFVDEWTTAFQTVADLRQKIINGEDLSDTLFSDFDTLLKVMKYYSGRNFVEDWKSGSFSVENFQYGNNWEDLEEQTVDKYGLRMLINENGEITTVSEAVSEDPSTPKESLAERETERIKELMLKDGWVDENGSSPSSVTDISDEAAWAYIANNAKSILSGQKNPLTGEDYTDEEINNIVSDISTNGITYIPDGSYDLVTRAGKSLSSSISEGIEITKLNSEASEYVAQQEAGAKKIQEDIEMLGAISESIDTVQQSEGETPFLSGDTNTQNWLKEHGADYGWLIPKNIAGMSRDQLQFIQGQIPSLVEQKQGELQQMWEDTGKELNETYGLTEGNDVYKGMDDSFGAMSDSAAATATNLTTVEDLLKRCADATGLSEVEFDTFAQKLYETNKISETTGKSFEEMKTEMYEFTYKVINAAEGLENLKNTSSKTWKILKGDIKSTDREYASALGTLRQNMAKIFNIDVEKITPEFAKKFVDEMHTMATGTEEEAAAAKDAIEDALVEKLLELDGIAEDTSVTINVNGQERAMSLLTILQDEFDALEEAGTISVGIDTSPALQALQQLVNAGTLTMDQVTTLLNAIHWNPEIDWVDYTIQEDATAGQITTVEDTVGGTRTITASTDLTTGGTISLPVIKGASQIDGGGGGNSGGGGGGGKAKTIKRKNPEDEKERYHHVNKDLDRLSDQMDEVGKRKSSIYGKKYIEYMKQEIELTQKQCDAYQRYIDEAKSYLELDTERVVSLGAVFDEYGNIANYDEVMDNILNKYNAFVDKYNAMTAKQQEDVAEEKEDWDEWYEEKKKWIETYEETVQTIYEQQNNLLEAQNEISAKTLEGIQYKVEMHVDITDAEKEFLEYLNDVYEEVLEKQGEVMDNTIDETKIAVSNLKVLGEAKEELDAAFASGELNQANYVEGLKDLNDQILENLENIADLKKEIEELYGETLETANDEFDTQTEKITNASDAMKSYISILGSIGKGSNLKELTKFYDSQYQYNLQSLAAQQEYLEILRDEERYYAERLNSAEGLTDTERKQYEALEETIQDVNSNILSDTESALDQITEAFNNDIEIIFDNLEEQIAGVGNSIQDLSDAYAYYQEEQERYVTTAKELYEVSKLNREIDKTMEDTTSKVHKDLLAALQERINKQSEMNELTEYDIEMNELQYQLLLKKIALEEAQNAKSTVRLTRDSGGNYVYQYTADQDDIAQKEQEYEDVLQQINELSVGRVQDLESQLLEIYESTLSSIKEVAEDETLTEQEKYDKIGVLMDQFKAKTDYIKEQYKIAADNLVESNETIAEHYGEELVEHSENAKNGMNQTISEMIDKTSELQQTLQTACSEAIPAAMDTMQARIDAVTGTVNLNYGTMTTSVNDYNAKIEDAQNQSELLAHTLQDSLLPTIHTLTTAWDGYSDALSGVITTYEDLYQAIVGTIEAQGDLTGTQQAFALDMSDYSSTTGQLTEDAMTIAGEVFERKSDSIKVKNTNKSNNTNNNTETTKTPTEALANNDSEKNKTEKTSATRNYMRFATGGIADFTGPAWLDGTTSQPELVLNTTDTQNILAAVQGVRSLDATTMGLLNNYITNASLAMSFGLGNITAGSVYSGTDAIQQEVHITAEFPNATNSAEIQDAFDNIINRAAQYVTTKR